LAAGETAIVVIDRLEELVGAPLRLEELKRKPGRRQTLRVVGRRRRAIVKVYASGRAPEVAARLAALAAGPAEPRLPTVLHLDPELHLLVLAEVPGEPLRAAALRDDLAACRRAGAAVGSWHRVWLGAHPPPLRSHTVERELELLHERSRCASPAMARIVRRQAEQLRGDWPISTVVHRDLYEEQILIGDRIGLIDLDDAAIGPPELDLGNLLAHLERLERSSGRGLAEATRTLRDGYEATGPDLDVALLDRCRRLSLLRLACIHAEPRLVPDDFERRESAPAPIRSGSDRP
jgi:Ser/Thr protein kinase RdoA (MazF antagonist)